MKHTHRFKKIDVPYWKSAPHIKEDVISLGQYRWDPIPHTEEQLTWLTGMRTMTTAGDVNTQAVFSLKGKPLNCYGLSKKIVYENEEFNLLQAALNIEESLEDLRYNNVVIATDADVDGMHIRLLLITFFLQFFPEVIKEGHLYILQTPLFRVRNKKETVYCYSEEERRDAIEKLKPKPEITRFKGLGEISPDEFVHFIGEDIRLDPVMLDKDMSIDELLSFYMGKNTPTRQEFIINNLKVELDLVEEGN